MNINIIGFTNYNIQDKSNLTYNYLNQNYPNSRKIAKLVKKAQLTKLNIGILIYLG